MVDGILLQGWKKGEDKDTVRKIIAEEDYPPWIYVQGEIFSRSRKVCLDENIRNKLGVTQQVIRERFSYQLLLTLCDTPLFGIWDGKWIPYYSEVDNWSNIYACQIGLGGTYVHVFKPMKLPESICNDG